jgi:ribosomal protein L37AE/L43A
MSNDNCKGLSPIGERETQRFDDVSNLLAQGLTRIEAGEQQAALNALAAATNRLGGPTYRESHPAGRALELINAAIDSAMIDSARKRKSARFATRQAMQVLVAAKEHERVGDGDLIADGGERVIQACPHCDSPDLVRRVDLEQARALWYCDDCYSPVEEPVERSPHSRGGARLSARLERINPSAVGGDD